jgi:CopG family nickel-responsive transcriptional regulator
MQRITLSVDDELVAALDRHMKARRYASRSEALRDILRQHQARESLQPAHGGSCVATLAYVYDHETRDLGRRLTRAQHHHHDLQVATLHVHLDHDSCLEVSVLRGPVKAVRSLADDTVSQRGVRHGELHVIPASEVAHRHSKSNP